jgi:DNA invertase Pin-like site-specific DNA recombinase
MMTSLKPVAVGYRRVSTEKQGKSGLGLEDQDRAIRDFCERRGLELDRTFTEVESGKNNGRPELRKALDRVKRLRGILVIATLSRLGRRVHFVSGLMESGVPFAAADAPDDEPFILHVKASFAEEEARKISQRTKAALAIAKARGVKLGTPANLTLEHRAKGAATNRARGQAERANLRPAILELRSSGASIRAIAKELSLSTTTVQRILTEPGTAIELAL